VQVKRLKGDLRGSNHITGTAEPKVVKFCTQVGYIAILATWWHNYHQQNGRGLGHITVIKFCHLSWCSMSRGYVSDSWATCCFLNVHQVHH